MNLIENLPRRPKVVTTMPCTALPRLMRHYGLATARLSSCVAQMSVLAYFDHGTFDRGWLACEAARAHCVPIQEQMYAHLREHRCALDVSRKVGGLAHATLTASPTTRGSC